MELKLHLARSFTSKQLEEFNDFIKNGKFKMKISYQLKSLLPELQKVLSRLTKEKDTQPEREQTSSRIVYYVINDGTKLSDEFCWSYLKENGIADFKKALTIDEDATSIQKITKMYLRNELYGLLGEYFKETSSNPESIAHEYLYRNGFIVTSLINTYSTDDDEHGWLFKFKDQFGVAKEGSLEMHGSVMVSCKEIIGHTN